MHGIVNRALQSFLRHTYGAHLWVRVAEDTGIGTTTFEALNSYDDAITEAIFQTAALHLQRPAESVMEDFGTWIVSAESGQPLRRLLRFGGSTFAEFLHSLEDLPERGRLALEDLSLPELRLREHASDQFHLICYGHPAHSFVFLGVLRVMADDYGALVMLEHRGRSEGGQLIQINLLQAHFAQAKTFELAQTL